MRKFILLQVLLLISVFAKAQFLMDMVDTTKEMGKGMLLLYKKFDNIRMSGYIQPQFQVISTKGGHSFNGGDFPVNVNNRFMLRRGRIKFDYVHFSDSKGPSVQFVFQFDGSERGVFIRDFWGRIMENRFQLFSFTTGMFARPFGYEVNLSSSDRESPERGRMSQLLMKTERDLGAMISFDTRKKDHPLRYLKMDLGFFNGQGLSATTDFDSRKDLISRIAIKPYPISKKIRLSAGISYLNGGLIENTKYSYKTENISGKAVFIVDSNETNKGKIAPRKYYGADMQLKWLHKYGSTELRGEFITGTQTSTQNNTETPAVLLLGMDGYYIRKFNGAYFYLLHNIFSTKHQLGIKYDWYDPNTSVKGMQIGEAGTNLTTADIKYSTLGFGYIYYATENVKLLLWYDRVINEKTQLPGFTGDIKDDMFTCRLQFRF